MPRRRKSGSNSLLAVAALSFALGAGAMALVGQQTWASPAPVPATPAPQTVSEQFPLCHKQRLTSCIIDGDTLRIDGTDIRLADIDAPEIYSPKCPSEKALGDRATDRLAALVNAGPFSLKPGQHERDLYGRPLRILVRDGRSLGLVLVGEGLARPWAGKREPWCV
jgi:micrococcal nuclease